MVLPLIGFAKQGHAGTLYIPFAQLPIQIQHKHADLLGDPREPCPSLLDLLLNEVSEHQQTGKGYV